MSNRVFHSFVLNYTDFAHAISHQNKKTFHLAQILVPKCMFEKKVGDEAVYPNRHHYISDASNILKSKVRFNKFSRS